MVWEVSVWKLSAADCGSSKYRRTNAWRLNPEVARVAA